MCGLFGVLLCCVGICEGVGGEVGESLWPRADFMVRAKCIIGVGIC